MLPSLITMPPPPRVNLRCMNEWQMTHEVCEFLRPKARAEDGTETRGVVFGDLINYNDEEGGEGLGWNDLIPQVVWRGTDFR